MLAPGRGWGQATISVGTPYSQNFIIGTTSTAALPTGWKVDAQSTVRVLGIYSVAGSATTQAAGGGMSGTASGGIYNYGAGTDNLGTDRAVGGLSASSNNKSVNVYVDLLNNGVGSITSFTISYNVEKYRTGTNPAGYFIQMYYSTNGTNWTSAGPDFYTSFVADATTSGYTTAPGVTTPISSKTLTTTVTSNSHLYLAWQYSVISGTTTSSAQGLGIDDVSITANGSTPTITLSDNGTQVSAGNVTQGTSNHIMSTFKLDVTVANATLTGASFLTAGNYLAADINGSGFKLWYNSTNNFATASAIGSPLGSTSTGIGDILVFSSLSQVINSGSSGYFWVTANIASGATVGRTINLTAIANADLTFSAGSKTGSATAGGAQTIVASTTPAIFLNASLNAFSAVSGTASASQSYTVSGDNLTTNVVVTAPAKYEVSTDNSAFSASVELVQSGGNIVDEPKTVHVRIAANAAVGTASGNITHESAGANTENVALSGTVYSPEPTNHPTSFVATANSSSQITVTWADATGGQLPTAYLVKVAVNPSTPTAPLDGTPETDALLIKNVVQGTQTATFTGLAVSTTYNFSIWPYTNSGININYKTDGTVPTASAATQEIASIKWDGGASTTAWTDANNWNGNAVPLSTDNVLLDNSLVSGSYSVVLPSGAVKTTINKLTITPTLPNIITLTLPSGNTYGAANDAGFIVGDNTASTDDIILNEGGVLVNASGGSSGNGIQVNALANGTCRINNGGKFIHNTARSTAGTAAAIILSAAPGTEYGIYEYDVPGSSSFAIAAAGRTYGSLVFSKTSGTGGYASSGGTPLIIKGNLTFNSGVVYTTTMSGSLDIAGNLTNNGTALTIAATQTVIFNGTSTQLISGTNNITFAGAVTINSGATVSIAPTIGVTVTGALTNSAGNSGLVIKSDATGTGSLITSSTPDATVERYLTNYSSSSDKKYHFLSSPVALQAIQPGFVADPPASNVDFFSWDIANGKWKNSKNDAGTWNTNFETTFGVGKGYLVAYPTAPVTKNFTGALNSAASNLVLTCFYNDTKGNGWNLLGNPFPSAIDYAQINSTRGDGMDAALYYYDAATSNYLYYIKLSDGSIGSGSQYIPSMQGFMVHAKSTGTKTITLNNSQRVHNGQTIYYKSAETVPSSLSLSVSAGGFKDEMFVHFRAGATTQFDGEYDAYKLPSYSAQTPQIYTTTSDQIDLAINGLPQLSEGLEIPVSFKAGIFGQQTITADVSQAGSTVFLTDLKTSATQNLRANPTYTFTAADGDATNRFVLRFAGVGINEASIAQPIVVYTAGNAIYVGSKTGALLKGEVFVYNMMGQTLLHQHLGETPLTRLNFDGATGYYIVKVVTPDNLVTRKVFFN